MGLAVYFCMIFIFHYTGSQFIENARVVNLYKDSVDFAWDPYPSATRYSISWGFTNITAAFNYFTSFSKSTIQELNFGSDITIYITVVQINGKNLQKSDYKSVEKPLKLTIDRNVSRPTVVGLKISNINGKEFTLSWDPYPSATRYNIIFGTDVSQKEIRSNDASIRLKTNRCIAASLVQVTEINNTMLDFIITSAPLRFSVLKVTTTRVVHVYNNSIDLSWDPVAANVLYRVELINSSIYFTSKQSFSFLNLKPNAMYTIEVTVAQLNGTVVRKCVGTPVRVITNRTESRPEITNLTLKESNESSLTLQWNAFENATSYKVSYRSKSSEKSNFTSSNEYTFEDLRCDTERTVSVEVFQLYQNETPPFIIKSQNRTFSTATCGATVISRLSTLTMHLIGFVAAVMIF